MQEAAELVNRVAPEHLELAVRDVDGLLADIRHAGAIFMGRWGCEALGDYCAGPSHVLPTMRTPRFSSPLGVYDFQKRSSLIEPSATGADHLAKVAATLARAEGLEAHAQSAEYRLGGDAHQAAAGTVSPARIAARVERHVRPDVQRMAAYHVADATDAIKLDAMENPWRLPGALQAELAQRLAALAINRYPSGNTYTALKQAIARHDGLDGIDGLVLGNGSDELISLLCQLVAQPGATIMAPAPSFVMYEMGARLAGVGFVPVPLRPDFSLDREAMLQAIETHRPALVFLAYPNNPTGNLFDADDVRAILQATDGLVVLDEAYAPFAGGASWLSQLTAWPNLAVMRTCSKWGLAGARIGYLASAPAWAAQLDKIRPPYNISALDAETACFAFQHHADFDHQTQALCTERQTLVQRLQALRGPQGLSHVYPTAANFVLVRLAGGQDDASGPSRATRVAAAMRAAGVLIKDASRMHPALAECLRLTVGAPEENEAMLQALAAALDAVPAASAGLADGASRTADANGRAHGERTSS